MAKKSAGGFDAQGQRVQNVGTPTDPADASSKSYVDGLVVKNNFAATAAPAAGNDSSQGYAVGSVWMVPSTGDMWRARSVSVGAARWIKLGIVDHPGYVPGRFYLPSGQGGSLTGAVTVVGTAYFAFGIIKERITVSQLGVQVTAASAGGNFQLALYSHNPATGLPSTLAGATGSGTTAGTNLVNVALSASATIEPGFYWFAYNCDNATAVCLSVGGTNTSPAAQIGSANGAIINSSSGQLAGLTAPIAFGAWPADVGALTFTIMTARVPMIQFLVASVP
ncbi:hypothetical protein [Methylobacterium sp. WL19]|uniref:hypothetical protein n=1 Tax=Methylobacterium sp. WL19 TaxID=2603896 RepID=UPI0011C86329|nr:hypothetical protein [Methylobacterium sp. WL19]TXN33886.1 hypothetical protein FV220_00085 [Methylobacterium sp. WL19]